MEQENCIGFKVVLIRLSDLIPKRILILNTTLDSDTAYGFNSRTGFPSQK